MIHEYIRSEVERQHSTNYQGMVDAYNYLMNRDSLDEASLQAVAHFVESDVNAMCNNYRTSHVGFYNGGSAAPAGEVRPRMNRWWYLIDEIIYPGSSDVEYVDVCVKQLLQIHPWADGNGRTASLLRNFWLGKIAVNVPEPLPYYEF